MPIDALRAATTTAVGILGYDDDDRGQIAEGFLADIIAVPGNPLENIRVMEDVEFVMKGWRVSYLSPSSARRHRGVATARSIRCYR